MAQIPTAIGLRVMGLPKDYEVLNEVYSTSSIGVICKMIRRRTDGKELLYFEASNYGAMSSAKFASFFTAANLLRQLRHPHILRYYDWTTAMSTDVVVEYCAGGDLRTLIKRCRCTRKHVDEDFIWKVIWQTSLGLREWRGSCTIINMRSCHLEPSSVLLDAKSNVKLSVLDLRILRDSSTLKHSGDYRIEQISVGASSCYISPEQQVIGYDSEKSDVWSMGCLFHELCSLIPPFTTETRTSVFGGRIRRIPPIYSDELDALINSMLTVEVAERPSLDMVMQHPRLVRFQCRKPIVKQHRKASEPHHQCPVEANAEGGTLNSRRQNHVNLKIREQILLKKEKHVNSREEELNKREEHLKLQQKKLDDCEEELIKRQQMVIGHEEKYKRLANVYLRPMNEINHITTAKDVLKAKPGTPKKLKSSRRWTSSTLSSRASAARHHGQKKLLKAKKGRFKGSAELDSTVNRENETSLDDTKPNRVKYHSAVTSSKENRSALDVSFNTRMGTMKTRLARAQLRALRIRTEEIESRMKASLVI